MNTKDELLKDLGETFGYATQYIDQHVQYLKLETAERIAKSTSSLITYIAIAFMVAMFMIMLSIATGFFLGQLLGSYSLSFFIVTLVYGIAAVLVYFFKKDLVTNPVLNIVIKSFFD